MQSRGVYPTLAGLTQPRQGGASHTHETLYAIGHNLRKEDLMENGAKSFHLQSSGLPLSVFLSFVDILCNGQKVATFTESS